MGLDLPKQIRAFWVSYTLRNYGNPSYLKFDIFVAILVWSNNIFVANLESPGYIYCLYKKNYEKQKCSYYLMIKMNCYVHLLLLFIYTYFFFIREGVTSSLKGSKYITFLRRSNIFQK